MNVIANEQEYKMIQTCMLKQAKWLLLVTKVVSN